MLPPPPKKKTNTTTTPHPPLPKTTHNNISKNNNGDKINLLVYDITIPKTVFNLALAVLVANVNFKHRRFILLPK